MSIQFLQQTANIQGPKVQIELSLGAINIFLSPRQLHALIFLSNVFFGDTPNEKKEHRPEESDDENERDSNYKQFNAMSGNLGLTQGWSSDPNCKCLLNRMP